MEKKKETQVPSGAYLSPAAVARDAKDIEKTSQLSQKCFLTSAGLTPMCDRLQSGRIFSA